MRIILQKHVTILFLTACLTINIKAADRKSFNENWKFHLGNVANAEQTGFDDSGWRLLSLPHDWSIEGKFSENNPATPGGGALPGGIGWYRKAFTVDAKDTDKVTYITFDGIYRCSEVWVNGKYLGKRPFGYNSIRYDLSKYLTQGTNIIAVKVDNSEQPNSRWYSGSGIFRNVWLDKAEKVHIAPWGTYITTPTITTNNATVNIQTTIANSATRENNIKLFAIVLDENNKEIVQNSIDLKLTYDSIYNANQTLIIPSPMLWSIEKPTLYKVISRIQSNGNVIDEYITSFGVRSFKFTADSGFFLNGKNIKIKGVCNHHDLGCLGSAINTRAIERQLQLLKEMGCNGIRTSHNPPAPELLDLCDKMGFIVMDEAFDMWRKKKSQYDYGIYFNEWHERDLKDMVLRDRNHPCIFLWSIGNEILEQWTDVKADTLDLKEANLLLNFKKNISQEEMNSKELNVNSLLAIKLTNIVKNLDPTRPVTSANNEAGTYNNILKSGAMDVIGFNYHNQDILNFTKNFPGKPFLATETTSGLMTRGYYRMPSDSMFKWPVRWDIPFSDPSFSCSSYDNCHAPWGSNHEETWNLVKKNPYVSGMYIWTGFDYLGEPTPYWWPARSSYFGIIDLAGFPKDIYYMYQSEWTNKPVLHLFPHWNWKPGETVDVWAYYNNADEVELFLNGKSLGIKSKADSTFHVQWRVKFEPGILKTVSRKDGKEVLIKEIKTTGTPESIILTADRQTIQADGKDLSFITAKIVDKDGNTIPFASNSIKFSIEGVGTIAGTDNGNPTSLESLKSPEKKAFNGLCLAVIQSEGKAGNIKLTATAEGLKTSNLTIEAK